MSDRNSLRAGWRDRENDAKSFEEIRRLSNKFHGMDSEAQENKKSENNPPKTPEFKVTFRKKSITRLMSFYDESFPHFPL